MVTVREWKSMVDDAVGMLGAPWIAVGSGRSLALAPGGCDGWWAGYIYLDRSSLQRLVAYNAFLGRALLPLETGDGGANVRDLKFGGQQRRSSRDWHNAEAVVDFARAANEQIYAKNPGIEEDLTSMEASYQGWIKVGRESIVKGPSRQMLVASRVICASQPVDELIASVDWVLAEENLPEYPSISTPFGGAGPSIFDFFTDLRGLLVADDRPGVEELILDTRAKSLAVMGIPNIGVPEFPRKAVS